MKKKSIIILAIVVLFVFFAVATCFGVYYTSLLAVDKNSTTPVEFVITKGEATNTIIENLKKDGLIKSDLALKIYVKMNPGVPQAGSYMFTKNMSAIDIYDSILSGHVTFDTIWVTFVEGKRLTYIVDVINRNFGFAEEDIWAILDDKEYVRYLINKYDFLTEDVLNDQIYHPLEGYLFPDTYEFTKDVTIKEIIERMLDNTASKLSKFASEFENSSMSVHELMTLASIVELEGARSDDRAGVAGVFYNRLRSSMTLGSDVTTYYAVGKDFSQGLYNNDLNTCNGYNTRGNCVKGLPVGPIANFGIDSLKATLEPKAHDYYFFVADKNMKTYFSKTNGEHQKIVNDLKSKGLWFTY